MEIIQRFICNHCQKSIEPETGIIIQGNVFIIKDNINDRAGVIGNMFPEPDSNGNISFDGIEEVTYHKKCLFDCLEEQLGEK